jgi:hypothetical protein
LTLKNVTIKNVGKAHKQTILVTFSLAYIAPFLYLYSRYLTEKDARKQGKSERTSRTPFGEMRPFISGEYAPEG